MMRTASEKLAIAWLRIQNCLCVERWMRSRSVAPVSTAGTVPMREMDWTALPTRRASRRHWNRIPDSVRSLVVEVALDRPELTPRELAWHITDTHDYFVSESSVYRILKAHDLITSPQFTVMRAADKFQHPTSRVHQLWQTRKLP